MQFGQRRYWQHNVGWTPKPRLHQEERFPDLPRARPRELSMQDHCFAQGLLEPRLPRRWASH